jgi:hypothetical protein
MQIIDNNANIRLFLNHDYDVSKWDVYIVIWHYLAALLGTMRDIRHNMAVSVNYAQLL